MRKMGATNFYPVLERSDQAELMREIRALCIELSWNYRVPVPQLHNLRRLSPRELRGTLLDLDGRAKRCLLERLGDTAPMLSDRLSYWGWLRLCALKLHKGHKVFSE